VIKDEGAHIHLRSDRDKGIALLFERYSKKLLNYTIRKWKIEEDTAWDLVYKTIYKVADKAGEYEFESGQRFQSFLFKVLINNIRDHLRSVKGKIVVSEMELNDAMISERQAESTIHPVSFPLKVLQEELDKLEDWERILVLMRTQDIPYSEIAKYVDKPENQLKTYYARIKKQLMERVNAILTNTNLQENA
jgi:RNA polymerase sigma factor (sigma-70 family)